MPQLRAGDPAHTFLQDALAAAVDSGGSATEIRVARGTYKPDQGASQAPRDRGATFQLVDGVTLEGGYAGCGAPDPDARDVDLNESVLSGDLNGDDATGGSNSENCRHVVTASGVDASAVLDGVTITAGNADGSGADGTGGGMLVANGWPTLIDCTFRANSAVFGGGMRNYDSNPTLENCTFDGNLAVEPGGGGDRPLLGREPHLLRGRCVRPGIQCGSDHPARVADLPTLSCVSDDCCCPRSATSLASLSKGLVRQVCVRLDRQRVGRLSGVRQRG